MYKYLGEKDVCEIDVLWQNFDDKWSESQMLSAFNGGRFFAIGKYFDNVLVGVICCSVAIDECDLELVYVSDSVRRQGVARSLVEKAIATLIEKDVKRVFLEVRESNVPAISLYKSTGFSQISIRKNYYKDGENAVVMKKELL